MSVAGPIKLQMKYVSNRNQHLKREGRTEKAWKTADKKKKKNHTRIKNMQFQVELDGNLPARRVEHASH